MKIVFLSYMGATICLTCVATRRMGTRSMAICWAQNSSTCHYCSISSNKERDYGTHLTRHGVCVKDREDQSQDGSIEETKVGLEDDVVEGRGGRRQEVHLVSN